MITETGTHRSSNWGKLLTHFSGEDKLLLSTSRANSNYVFIDVSNVKFFFSVTKKMKVNWVNCILNGRHSFFLFIIWITQVPKSNFRIHCSPNINYCRTNSIPRSSGDLQWGRVQSPGKQLSKVYKQRLTLTQVSLNELLFIKKIIKFLSDHFMSLWTHPFAITSRNFSKGRSRFFWGRVRKDSFRERGWIFVIKNIQCCFWKYVLYFKLIAINFIFSLIFLYELLIL